jgi:hypothetical protein
LLKGLVVLLLRVSSEFASAGELEISVVYHLCLSQQIFLLYQGAHFDIGIEVSMPRLCELGLRVALLRGVILVVVLVAEGLKIFKDKFGRLRVLGEREGRKGRQLPLR